MRYTVGYSLWRNHRHYLNTWIQNVHFLLSFVIVVLVFKVILRFVMADLHISRWTSFVVFLFVIRGCERAMESRCILCFMPSVATRAIGRCSLSATFASPVSRIAPTHYMAWYKWIMTVGAGSNSKENRSIPCYCSTVSYEHARRLDLPCMEAEVQSVEYRAPAKSVWSFSFSSTVNFPHVKTDNKQRSFLCPLVRFLQCIRPSVVLHPSTM